MKRIFTLLLTLVMTFSLAIPAQAANSTKASTMRLMETEGTATVENAIGKKLSIQDKMRLYSGYEVSTEKASYAYISLDNNKAVKLDASSAVKVNQSGKKLELDVTAGELMFNVPVALKSDESLNIRTSTMVTGIRGTAGWVNALDRYTTRVGVLEGSVTIQSKDPFTGADRSVTIVGGQIATIIRHERANAIQQQLIDDGVIIEENIVTELTEPGQIVEEIQEADIPGFVAEEVSSNSDLQDRISEESPLNADEIIQDAEKRLAEEEKAAEKQDALIQKELKELDATDPGLPFATPEVIVQTNTVIQRVEVPSAPPSNPEYIAAGLNDPSAEQVMEAMKQEDTVAVTNADLDLKDLTIESGKTLYIVSGAVSNTGAAPEVRSANIAPVLTGQLVIGPDAEFYNDGFLQIGRAYEPAMLTQRVSVPPAGLFVYGFAESSEGSTLYVPSGYFDVGGTYANWGMIYADGGSISTFGAGLLENYGPIYLGYGSSLYIFDKSSLYDYSGPRGIYMDSESSLSVDSEATFVRDTEYGLSLRNSTNTFEVEYTEYIPDADIPEESFEDGYVSIYGTYIDQIHEVMIVSDDWDSEGGSVLYMGSFHGALAYAEQNHLSYATIKLLNRGTLSHVGGVALPCDVTLDLNGNHAKMNRYGGEGATLQATFLLDDSGFLNGIDSYTMRIEDSGDEGFLEGSIEINEGFSLCLADGMICKGYTPDVMVLDASHAAIINKGYFKMSGGTVVSNCYYNNSPTAALDLRPSAETELIGGTLVSLRPTTTGVMYNDKEVTLRISDNESLTISVDLFALAERGPFYVYDTTPVLDGEGDIDVPVVNLARKFTHLEN
jgi:hypothetical protein